MALKFSLAEMQATLDNSLRQTAKYSDAINTLDAKIKELSEALKTSEVGIYEALVSKYNENRQTLFDAREYMTNFCNKLNSKMLELDETSTAVKNSFN